MHALALLVLVLVSACADVGNAPLGEACASSDECANSFCVAGEAASGAFCSRDCRGRLTGEICGEDDKGRCIADAHEWCWIPCESDAECEALNPERGSCAVLAPADFKVCLSTP